MFYRSAYPQGFASASDRLDIWLGTINTAVLICSSFHDGARRARWSDRPKSAGNDFSYV
jgi:hypothetical protein